jgi:Flp pilus assembly protein TadD
MRYWVIAFMVLASAILGHAGVENHSADRAARASTICRTAGGAVAWGAARRMSPEGTDIRATLESASSQRGPAVASR